MTTAFNLIHTDLFHGSPVNIYENTSNEIFMTARQLATCLEYSRKSQFEKLLSHHPELRENEFSLLATIPVPQTLAYSKAKGLSQQIFVNQQTRLFNENGIYEICALSRKPRARELYHHVKQFSYILHSVQVQVATTHQTQLMALQNQLSLAAASLSQIHTDIKRLQTITQYIADAFTDTYAEEQMSCS